MSFDVYAIAALVDELSTTLSGGRVQDVIDVDAMGVGFEIYANRRRHYLYMGADATSPRVHLVADKLRRGTPKPTQLGLACRRLVEGGSIQSISQPPWERLLRVDIAGRQGDVALIAEVMPRRANVLLVRAGMIIDCLNRVGPAMNRYRLSLPNHKYVPPPPLEEKLSPASLTAAELDAVLDAVEKPATQLRRILPRQVMGMSPLLAGEIAYRVTGSVKGKVRDSDAAALYAAMQQLLPPLLRREWQPGVGYENGVAHAFSVFPLTCLQWRPETSVSAAASAFFGATVGVDAYKEAKRPAGEAIDAARAKLIAKRESLRRSLRDEAELEALRQSGELILAHQYTIAAGQKALRAQYELDSAPLEIKLDPKLAPLENAKAYFRRYAKAKSAREDVPKLIAKTALELDFLAQLENDLALASNWTLIDEVIQNLRDRGYWAGKTPPRVGGGRQGPLRIVSGDGFVIFVGRNSRQNAALISKTARSSDIWLHARGVAGAHVIIRDDGRRISPALIEKAAAVAAHYSQAGGESPVRVDYTRVKYVKAIKGAGPGMVTYRNEKTLRVVPRDESIMA